MIMDIHNGLIRNNELGNWQPMWPQLGVWAELGKISGGWHSHHIYRSSRPSISVLAFCTDPRASFLYGEKESRELRRFPNISDFSRPELRYWGYARRTWIAPILCLLHCCVDSLNLCVHLSCICKKEVEHKTGHSFPNIL